MIVTIDYGILHDAKKALSTAFARAYLQLFNLYGVRVTPRNSGMGKTGQHTKWCEDINSDWPQIVVNLNMQ